VVDQPNLTREQYLELGVRQSIFLQAERDAVYDLFEQYLRFLATEGYYNANILAFERLALVQPVYDYVVADEVQDLTAVQLHLALRALRAEDCFILCGDANQVVHLNFFSWAQVKSLFYERRTAGRAEIIRVLDANYRNARQVVDLANRLLLVEYAAVHDVPHLLAALSAHKFTAALQPANQRLSIEHRYYSGYRGGAHDVRQKAEVYGVDFRNPLNQTPLMIAAYLGLEELAR
jgi:hypothetical protein